MITIPTQDKGPQGEGNNGFEFKDIAQALVVIFGAAGDYLRSKSVDARSPPFRQRLHPTDSLKRFPFAENFIKKRHRVPPSSCLLTISRVPSIWSSSAGERQMML